MVSARKYRPNKFSEVFGQESITKALEKSISNQMLSQAYLFCGPRGVGKLRVQEFLLKKSIIAIKVQKIKIILTTFLNLMQPLIIL